MKKLYWRPQRLSTRVILLLALVAAICLTGVESFRTTKRQSYFSEKITASRSALRGFHIIREERKKRNIPIDDHVDPSQSGLIGRLITPVTTNTGHLSAKQTSVNPNFAAVVVHLLRRAGVEPGDSIAVGLSGSFPAMNIATYAAIKALNLKAIVVSSAGASQWGANIPSLLWPDMEQVLNKNGLFKTKSVAFSLGGIDDNATGLSDAGRELLVKSILDARYRLLEVDDFRDSIRKRMAIYREQSSGNEIRAYINVGGGTISVGTRVGKMLFKEGLNRYLPRGASGIDSIMIRFAKTGVPVIHLTKIAKLAERYGLPLEPVAMPLIGEGKIFAREGYNLWLALGSIGVIVFLMIGFLRLDLAYRLFPSQRAKKGNKRVEPMV